MTLLEELKWRGLLAQMTHEDLGERLERERLTLYCGFDPTADSLHIGSLLPIIGLMHFQRRGHTPIAVVGGGTGMIGDPSFKAQERQLLTAEQVETNRAGIQAQLERFLDFSGGNAARVINNGDWLGELKLLPFLRDIGKHFSVNAMLAKDSVRQRLEDRDQGISYTEFTYSLLQAYDFLYLYDTTGCRLQIGGSDQWGNIVAGMDLTRRLRGAETYGLTLPLVTKADGSKFGKTESGNVWLDPNRTSPYKFYQFWINTSDADVLTYLKYFTFFPVNGEPGGPTVAHEELEAMEAALKERPEARAPQRLLAERVTTLVHGEAGLTAAQRATNALFGGDLSGLDEATLEDVFSEVPSSEVSRDMLSGGRLLLDVLVECGVFGSKGEAKRLVANGGLYLNNQRIDAEDAKLSESSLLTPRLAVVRKGKKNYHLLRFA